MRKLIPEVISSPYITSLFCETGVISELIRICDINHKASNLSLLKAFSIFILNAKNKTTLYYFFSNVLITRIIQKPCKTQSEDYIYFYINLLKSLSLRIEENTLNLFFRPHYNSYPLLENAIKYYNYNDGMIRNSVRNIVLTQLKSFQITRSQFQAHRLLLLPTNDSLFSLLVL